jgi:hypothetical protein
MHIENCMRNTVSMKKPTRSARSDRTVERPPGQPVSARKTGLYLLALRSRVAHAEPLVPGRKLIIPIEPAAILDPAPEAVRIVHR